MNGSPLDVRLTAMMHVCNSDSWDNLLSDTLTDTQTLAKTSSLTF